MFVKGENDLASKTELLAIEIVEPIITSLGYELADLEFVKKNNGMNMTVFITKGDEPITIEDCEKVHRAIDLPLDEGDPTSGASYILNVSSLGLDRIFKYDKDYLRYLNKEIVVKLYAPIDKCKEFVGVLETLTEDAVTLNIDGKQIVLPRQKIAMAQPYIRF